MGRARNQLQGSVGVTDGFEVLWGRSRGRSARERQLEAERERERTQLIEERARDFEPGDSFEIVAALASADEIENAAAAAVIARAVSDDTDGIYETITSALKDDERLLVRHPLIIEALVMALEQSPMSETTLKLLGIFLNWAELEEVQLRPLMPATVRLIESKEDGQAVNLHEIARAVCEFPEKYPQLLEAFVGESERGNAHAFAAAATGFSCAPDCENTLLAGIVRVWREHLQSHEIDQQLMLQVLGRYPHRPQGVLGEIIDLWAAKLPSTDADSVAHVLALLSFWYSKNPIPMRARGYSKVARAATDALARTCEREDDPSAFALSHIPFAMLQCREDVNVIADEAREIAKVCEAALTHPNSSGGATARVRRACAQQLRAATEATHDDDSGVKVLETVIDDVPEISRLVDVCAQAAAVEAEQRARAVASVLWEGEAQRERTLVDAAARARRSQYREALLRGHNPEEGDRKDNEVFRVLVEAALADRKALCQWMAEVTPREYAGLWKVHGRRARAGTLYRLLDERSVLTALQEGFAGNDIAENVFDALAFAYALRRSML